MACSGVMSALLPCANSLAENPFACDGVIVVQVNKHRYSVGMWAAAFMAGVIGSSGNLILVPYLSRFRGIFTSAYFAGRAAANYIMLSVDVLCCVVLCCWRLVQAGGAVLHRLVLTTFYYCFLCPHLDFGTTLA